MKAPELRPWPIEPALEAMRADRTFPHHLESLAQVNLRHAEAHGGFTTSQADRVADVLGLHPTQIWDNWGMILEPDDDVVVGHLVEQLALFTDIGCSAAHSGTNAGREAQPTGSRS